MSKNQQKKKNQERQRAARRREKAKVERVKWELSRRYKTFWEDWNEDSTQPKPTLLLKAASYRPQLVFDIPAGDGVVWPYLVSPQGNFSYANQISPAFFPLPFQGQEGMIVWDGPIVVPTLKSMNRDIYGDYFPPNTPEFERVVNGHPWMSVVVGEVFSQRSGIEKAKGKVVVGGLGLGWFLKKVCQKDSVEEVVLIERSQELLDWYGYGMCQSLPKVKEVICNDVYAEVHRFPEHQLLLDIWPILRGEDSSETDPHLARLRQVAGDRVWAWGMD